MSTRQILAISYHSFIDVITNSSTELFVCNTDKSLKMVEEILKDILKTHNEEVKKGYIDGHDGRALKFDDCFLKPYIYTKEVYEKDTKGRSAEWLWGYEKEETIGKIMIIGAEDNSIPYYLWDKINHIFNSYNYHLG